MKRAQDFITCMQSMLNEQNTNRVVQVNEQSYQNDFQRSAGDGDLYSGQVASQGNESTCRDNLTSEEAGTCGGQVPENFDCELLPATIESTIRISLVRSVKSKEAQGTQDVAAMEGDFTHERSSRSQTIHWSISSETKKQKLNPEPASPNLFTSSNEEASGSDSLSLHPLANQETVKDGNDRILDLIEFIKLTVVDLKVRAYAREKQVDSVDPGKDTASVPNVDVANSSSNSKDKSSSAAVGYALRDFITFIKFLLRT